MYASYASGSFERFHGNVEMALNGIAVIVASEVDVRSAADAAAPAETCAAAREARQP